MSTGTSTSMDGDTGSCAFEKRKNPKGFREKKTKVGKCKRKSLVDTLHVPIGQGKADAGEGSSDQGTTTR